jgi:hypothetical protein
MNKIYTNSEELKLEYGLYKTERIYKLLEETFKLESKKYNNLSEKYKNKFLKIELDFYKEIQFLREEIAPLNSLEEEIILTKTFNLILKLEKEFKIINNHFINSFPKERIIKDRIIFFHYETTLEFFLKENNYLDISIEEEAKKFINNLSVFQRVNIFKGE